MKKKSLLMVLVLMAAAVASYGKGPIVFDKSVPADQCSTLMVSAPTGVGVIVKISKFNGKNVSWKPGLTGAPTNVIIPASTHSLRFSCQEERGLSLVATMKITGSIDITHTFLAGHTYFATAEILTDGNNMQGKKVQAYILDITPGRDFVPPNRAAPNASPFEGEWVRSAEVQDVTVPIQLFITGDEWAMKQNGQFTQRGYVLQKKIWSILAFKFPKAEEKVLFVTGQYNAEENKWEFPITIVKNKKGKETTLYGFAIRGNDFVTCDGTFLSVGNEADTKNIAVKVGDPVIGVYTRAK